MSKEQTALLETFKRETRVLGDIQRELLARPPGRDRAREIIHPSEISKSTWCPRATYYRLAGFPETVTPTFFGLDVAYQEGHEIHRKWQNWMWDAGILEGMFSCLRCGNRWWDKAPKICAGDGCIAGRVFLQYKEVPLSSEKYLIGGHADALANNAVVEIKSVGLGTLRFEDPARLEMYTHELGGRTVYDLDGLWDSIKRPFAAHRRQGCIYAFCLEMEEIVFIYECKWNQRTKEFLVRYNPRVIEPVLYSCLDIKEALDGGAIPNCIDPPTCAECKRFQINSSVEAQGERRDIGSAGKRRIRPAPSAQEGPASSSGGATRIIRRRDDEPVQSSNSLGRLFGRAADRSRDR